MEKSIKKLQLYQRLTANGGVFKAGVGGGVNPILRPQASNNMTISAALLKAGRSGEAARQAFSQRIRRINA